MKTTNRSALLAAAAMALVGFGSAVQVSSPGVIAARASATNPETGKIMPNRDASRATALKGILGGGRFSGKIKRRYPGVGWSVAQDRRMAKKRRNQQRNKRAHRRARV